jgi:hypothetical protein
LFFQFILHFPETTQYAQTSGHEKPYGKHIFGKARFEIRGEKFMYEKVKALNSEAIQIVGRVHHDESRLIEILQELDRLRGYFAFGVNSLFDYCLTVLKLSPAKTQNYLSVARKSFEVPALKAAIDAGELSICKARKIAPVISKTNHTEWLTLAKESSTREIEKAVAKAQPTLAVQERVKYVAEDRLSLTLGISEQALEKLKKVMDLESQRSKKSASREDALIAALDVYLERHDPVKKAERAELRAENKKAGKYADKSAKENNQSDTKINERVFSTQGNAQRVARHIGRREALPAALVHAVHMRDQRQCAHKINGKRCGATRWLDIHHIVPRSIGGTDTLENLMTVCSAHHRSIHSR